MSLKWNALCCILVVLLVPAYCSGGENEATDEDEDDGGEITSRSVAAANQQANVTWVDLFRRRMESGSMPACPCVVQRR